MLSVVVKFAVMWLVVELTIRLLGRFVREDWRPWTLVAVLTVAAVGLAWI
jgi:hypothetical protein